MSTLSHAAVGFLVARYFVEHGWLPNTSISPYALGVVFANLPDLDGLLSIRNLFNHQNKFKSQFHYPFNWFIVFTLAMFVLMQFRIPYAMTYAFFAFINIMGHFLLDTFSIYGGIAWLAPWKKRRFSFVKNLNLLPGNNKDWIRWYTKHWVMYLEVAVWIVTTIVLVNAT